MIAEKCHQEEWIKQKRKAFGNADPLIIEKVIKALTLLDSLIGRIFHSFLKAVRRCCYYFPSPSGFQ
jgi:hypothetical protein